MTLGDPPSFPTPPQDSRQHYEIEYRHRAANLEKYMSELWRMERKRDKNAREMKVWGLGWGRDPRHHWSPPGPAPALPGEKCLGQ